MVQRDIHSPYAGSGEQPLWSFADPMSDAGPTSWQPIETAPKDQEILIYTKGWGPIIASLSTEFGEWMSRMQVPVAIKEEGDLPTHWQPLPTAPEGAAAA